MDAKTYNRIINMYLPKGCQEQPTSEVDVVVEPIGREVEDEYRLLLKIAKRNGGVINFKHGENSRSSSKNF